MNFGVVIRSVGERTEALCLESARLAVEPLLVKNVSPHAAATKAMYTAMIKDGKKWYLSVDADIVLARDWFTRMPQIIKACGSKISIVPRVYEYIMNKTHGRGCRLYNAKYVKKCLVNLTQNFGKVKKNLFPEDYARKLMKGSFNIVLKSNAFIGFHGCEQYYTPVYNAYARYAIRAKGHKHLIRQWFGTVRGTSKDRKVAMEGWKYGLSHNITSKDFTKYIPYEPEKEPCTLTLDEFYDVYYKMSGRPDGTKDTKTDSAG